MIIDFLFLMIFLTMGVFGMRKGFIESLTDFLNLVVGISTALFFYVDLSLFISKYVSINTTIIIFFSIGIIFAISLVILRLLTSLLLFLFDGSISSYKTLNNILGFMLGIFKGAISLVLFTGLFEKYISVRLYEILFEQSKILVLLEPIKDYIFN
jgi:Colicin V production protein.